MKKHFHLVFAVIQIVLDYSLIILAGLSAYYLRALPEVAPYVSQVFKLDIGTYIGTLALMAPLFLVVFAFEGLYRSYPDRVLSEDIVRIIRGATLALVLFIIVIFLGREWFSSRFIILVGWMLTLIYLIWGRVLITTIKRYLLATRGLGARRVAIVGESEKLQDLRVYLSAHPEIGLALVDSMPKLSIETLRTLIRDSGIEEVIADAEELSTVERNALFYFCQINHVTYKVLPASSDAAHMRPSILNDQPILEYLHTPLDGWGRVVKRIFDVVGSIFLLIIALPIMLIIAIAVKVEDPSGPVVYRNKRVGEKGKEFYVYKFRYMYWKWCINKLNPNFDNAVAYEKELIETQSVRKGPLYKIKDDPRKTRVGAFIERYSLDELPQLFNVFMGTMSLVGPRPHQKREVEKYAEYHHRLMQVRPGISGMAQISGRSDLDFTDEYRLDIYYIENWSLWLDIIICLKTVRSLIARRKN